VETTVEDELEIKTPPANIKTVTLHIRKKGQYKHATITFPKDLVARHDLKDDEDVVICFLGRAKK
jgi:hypothetical protein